MLGPVPPRAPLFGGGIVKEELFARFVGGGAILNDEKVPLVCCV